MFEWLQQNRKSLGFTAGVFLLFSFLATFCQHCVIPFNADSDSRVSHAGHKMQTVASHRGHEGHTVQGTDTDHSCCTDGNHDNTIPDKNCCEVQAGDTRDTVVYTAPDHQTDYFLVPRQRNFSTPLAQAPPAIPVYKQTVLTHQKRNARKIILLS